MHKYLNASEAASIAEAYKRSEKRLVLLDYDGTLVPFHCDPALALPDEYLMRLLEDMTQEKNLDLVIISGRNRQFLEKVFSTLNATIFGEHGAVFRIKYKWSSIKSDTTWKQEIREIMQEAVECTPGSNLEKKENSIVWHYRRADQEIAEKCIPELIKKLTPVCNRNNLSIMKGRKIVEVKPSDYTKGTTIMNFFDCSKYDFILAAGDDTTDEDLFEALPGNAITIHVGSSSDASSYRIRNSNEFVNFLRSIISTPDIGAWI
ncbi:MAG TPA: trehalose-phosphatase [Bacteroidales bacterium]|nr:trehalose-phosphatase [Bacteroidales bacterium]